MRIAEIEECVVDEVEVEYESVIEAIDVVMMRAFGHVVAERDESQVRELSDDLAHWHVLLFVLHVHGVTGCEERGERG